MKRIFCHIAMLCVLCFALHAETKRGNLLGTEEVTSTSAETFTFRLVETEGSFPQLQFLRQKHITHHEVRVYEALEETVRRNQGTGITDRGTVERRVIPGKKIRGESVRREEYQDLGPLADTELVFEGRKIKTDEKGLWLDTSQMLLTRFDDSRSRSQILHASHPTFGEQTLEITRNFIRLKTMPTATERLEEKADLLEKLSLDFTQLKRSNGSGVEARLSFPDKGTAGTAVAATLHVRNGGKQPVCNLVARSFSSTPELNGIWFYFGNVNPGKDGAFSRLFTLPPLKGEHFVTFAFWNLHGAMPAQACNAKITIE